MDNSLIDSIIKVCEVLNKHSVEYLIVGGTAVAVYGFYRKSIGPAGLPVDKHDLDFWYNSTYGNYYKLLNAIEDLGQDVSEFRDEITPNPKKSYFRLEFDEFTIDFLPELKGLSKFSDSFKEKEISNIGGTQIPIIAFDHLIINKQENARDTDLNDIQQLKSKRDNSK